MEIQRGVGESDEMSKPVKIVLPGLPVTQLGHCYYFPSSLMTGLGEMNAFQSALSSPDTPSQTRAL